MSEAEQTPRTPYQRERAIVAGGLILAGVTLLLAGSHPWGHFVVRGTGPTVSRAATDSAAGFTFGAGLLALAALGGLLAARGVSRSAVGVVVMLAGIGVLVATVTHHREAADPTLAAIGSVQSVGSLWPAVAAFGAVIFTGSGAVITIRSRRWPGLGARYESGPRPTQQSDPWSSLDAGVDPTLDAVDPSTHDA